MLAGQRSRAGQWRAQGGGGLPVMGVAVLRLLKQRLSAAGSPSTLPLSMTGSPLLPPALELSLELAETGWGKG